MAPPQFNSLDLLNVSFAINLPRTQLALVAVAGLALYGFGIVVYRLLFDGLAKIPGPKLLALSKLPSLYLGGIEGTWVYYVTSLHRRYGPMVRIGPNTVAVDGAIAWPEVFGFRKGKGELIKPADYFFPGDGGTIINAQTTEIHRRQRRQLGGAFSETAMYEQESIIEHYISLLMQQLSERAERGESLDIVKWLNFTTFDIIGDLTFADSFHCLDSSEYHPWVENIFNNIKGSEVRKFFSAVPLLGFLMSFSNAAKAMRSATENIDLSFNKGKARIAQGESPSGRKDFMTAMLRGNRDGKGMSEHEIIVNSPLLITAGSETTATALSGFCFYLRSNPEAYQVLVDEIRGAFKSEDEINMRSTGSLQYLRACLDEALRIYPPTATSTPRVSTGEIIGGQYLPKGTIIYTMPWATNRNPEHFTDPESYHPERFLPPSHPRYQKRFENDNLSVWKPFSYGPRDCIGKNLANAEMRVIATRFLYRFDYTLEEGMDSWLKDTKIYNIPEKPALMLKLTPRKM